jgi:hypothetical protein
MTEAIDSSDTSGTSTATTKAKPPGTISQSWSHTAKAGKTKTAGLQSKAANPQAYLISASHKQSAGSAKSGSAEVVRSTVKKNTLVVI